MVTSDREMGEFMSEHKILPRSVSVTTLYYHRTYEALQGKDNKRKFRFTQ